MRVEITRSALMLVVLTVLFAGPGVADDAAPRGSQSVTPSGRARELKAPRPAQREADAKPPAPAKAIADELAKGVYAVLILHKGESVDELKSAITPLVNARTNTACFVVDARDAGMQSLFRELRLDPETAPTPLALVLAPGKIVTGVFLTPPNAGQFNEAILPVQPLAVRKALAEGKTVIVKMQTDTTTGNKETDKAVEQFLSGADNAERYVALPIRLDRPENGPFLGQLKIDPEKETKSVILAMAPPLKILSKPFRGAATKDIVAATVNPACATACAPGST